MSKTTFEKLGIPYEERDGIFYPVLVAGTEKADIDVGKYGRMWIKYIKEGQNGLGTQKVGHIANGMVIIGQY